MVEVAPMSFLELARSTSFVRGTSENEHPEVEVVALPSFPRAFAAVVLCGTLNNFSYCIISSASQNLAKHFHTESQVTLLTTCMNVSALTATWLHAKLLLGLRFRTRVMIALAMSSTAYAGVAMASAGSGFLGFAVAGMFSCFAGMAQIFGEITNLAFLKSFPTKLIGGWGAGTGIAGIAGGGLYIILSGPLGISNSAIFGMMMPLQLFYWGAFSYLHSLATQGREGRQLELVLGGRHECRSSAEGRELGESIAGLPHGTAPMTAANAKATVASAGSIMFNMVAVYLFEYIIYPGLDDRETLCASSSWYPAMWVSYNIGVTLSRFSVAVFRIRRVWLLTLLQALNVVGWTCEVYWGGIRNSLPHEHGLFLMTMWMVLVGMCGGATYGNCMYLFNNQEGIPNELRELGINLGFAMSNVGITLASLSFLLVDATIMSKAVLYPRGC